jgi:hypothetical protein
MKHFWTILAGYLIAAGIALLAGCAHTPQTTTVGLAGTQEVPPVNSSGMGTAEITVQPDLSVIGRVTTVGVAATSAHIHEGPPGRNGPVVIPLTKISETTFAVPAGVRLTQSQLAAYKAGNLYVNVHSTMYPDGEIRAQLAPISPAATGSAPPPASSPPATSTPPGTYPPESYPPGRPGSGY